MATATDPLALVRATVTVPVMGWSLLPGMRSSLA
jgi:hypothetical protein